MPFSACFTRAALFVAAAVLASAAKPTPKPKPPPLTPEQRAAQALLKPLSLRDRVAQLVIGVVYADPMSSTSTEFEKWRHWVRDLHIGGLIVNNAVQYGLVRNAEPHRHGGVPEPHAEAGQDAADGGRGFRARRFHARRRRDRFPYDMAFGAAGDLAPSRYEGRWPRARPAPSASTGSSRRSPTSTTTPTIPSSTSAPTARTPKQVSRYVTAFIDGAHADPNNRVLATAKHFPGHGDTAVDSHMDLARLDKDRERLDAIELKPFRGRHRARRRLDHDRAHGRARARAGGHARHRLAPSAHRSAAQ